MIAFAQLAWSVRGELLEATVAHLSLVFEAMTLAVALGVPLGVIATRSRWFEGIGLAIANALQTIPSLALLGLLLVLFGGAIGKPPARAALVVYALLPIMKNTILGIRGLDRGVAEASVGLGMTSWQRLLLVELPLAVPIIMGGVRVATVSSVGMATIAAAIGARGLGTYIFRGVALSDPRLILLGSIPAALLALLCDAALGEVERTLDPGRARRGRLRMIASIIAIGTLVLAAVLGALGEWSSSGSRSQTIVIGSKDGTEMILLGHMMADLVEDRTGLSVDRRLNLGGTLVCYNALVQGGLDAYVEYSGTALTTILKQPPQNDPLRVRERIRVLLGRDGVTCLDPFGFENTFAILMRQDQSDRLGIRTLSDAAGRSAGLRFGAGPEFMNREDGYPGLARSYGFAFRERPREMDRNLLYQAVAQGSIDLAAGDSTDGRIDSLGLVVLKDDRRYFPPYEAVPLVRGEMLERHPGVKEAIEAIAGRIDAATMQRLNRAVDLERREPRQVAREYLVSQGLVKPRTS